jgi:hypothetical protein
MLRALPSFSWPHPTPEHCSAMPKTTLCHRTGLRVLCVRRRPLWSRLPFRYSTGRNGKGFGEKLRNSRGSIDICDNRRGGFVNHPGPFNQKIELLAYELWQARGRPWGNAGGNGRYGRRATRGWTAWAPRSSSRRRDSPIRLDGKYFCRLAVSGVKPQPPARPCTDQHLLVIDRSLLTFVAIHRFAVKSFSAGPRMSIRITDLISIWSPCLVSLLSWESRGFRGIDAPLKY